MEAELWITSIHKSTWKLAILDSPVVLLMASRNPKVHPLRLGVSFRCVIPLIIYLFLVWHPRVVQKQTFDVSKFPINHLFVWTCLYVNTFRYNDIIFPNATSWTCAQSFCELRTMSLQEVSTLETGGPRHQQNKILNNKLSATKYAS